MKGHCCVGTDGCRIALQVVMESGGVEDCVFSFEGMASLHVLACLTAL